MPLAYSYSAKPVVDAKALREHANVVEEIEDTTELIYTKIGVNTEKIGIKSVATGIKTVMNVS